MQWVQHCIKNKLIVYIAAIAVCLIGLICLFTVPIAPFPGLKFNQLDVTFSYPGASASTVQSQVTEKVVTALKSTNNIQDVFATSRAGGTYIQLRLDSAKKSALLQTELNIMQAISSSDLPSSVSQPSIQQAAGVSELIAFIVSSKTHSFFDLSNFIQSRLYPKFSALPNVKIWTANQNPAVKIQLNPEKLAKYQLNPIDISQLINQSDQSNPMGNLVLNKTSYTLSTNDQLRSLSAFENLIIGYTGQPALPIYLKNIAHVTFAPQSIIPTSYSSFDGRTADFITLYTTARANPFTTVHTSLTYVNQLKQSLPNNIKITPIFNNAKTMQRSFDEVSWTILIAAILVLLIALMFLGHFRTTLIPIVTIPICLLGAVAVVNLLGYSVNILTLLALVIAVGLVVDDAIVVVENITRHIEQGMKKHEAVIEGTSDIALTIIGITLTLLAVYLPITFCSGSFITMLKAFAVPLASAVFISGIVALTLTPIMSMIFVTDHKPNAYQIRFNQGLKTIIEKYQGWLTHVFNAPRLSLLIIVVLIAGFGYLDTKLPQSYFPADPDGTVKIVMTGDGAQDNVASLKTKMQRFKPFYTRHTVEYYSLSIEHNSNTGQITATLGIHYKPTYLHQNIAFANQINTFIQSHHIQNTEAHIDKFSNWGNGADLSFYLYGAGTTTQINKAAQMLTDRMKKSPLFTLVSNTINQPYKQIEFMTHKAKAAQFGIYQNQIDQLLSTDYGGYTLNNNFSIDGLSVPVVVQLQDQDLMTPQSLQGLEIQSSVTNKFYPLNEFVSLKTVAKPEIISTLNGEPSVQINATLAKGASLSQAIPYTNDLLQQYTPTLQHQYAGNARSYIKGNKQTILIFLLGIVCIYCLLTILFGSLLDPLIILLTVPFSVIGGALSLYLIGGSLNLYSTLGLITLVGLITKHGVLIVQFANNQLKQGKSVRDAILIATHHRFRPIIMTTLVMTLGALPLILNDNLMYVARRDLGVVIIGGLLIGTLFSLFIVPLVYTLVKKHTET